MKKLSVFLLTFSSLVVTYSQEYYRYYGEEKHYFNVSPNKILVRFSGSTETDTVKSIVEKNSPYQVSDVSKTAYKELKIVSLQGTDTAATRDLVKQWKNTEQILYSGPVFVNKYRKTTNTQHFTSFPAERSNPEKNKNEKKIAFAHNIKKQTPLALLRNEHNKRENEAFSQKNMFTNYNKI